MTTTPLGHTHNSATGESWRSRDRIGHLAVDADGHVVFVAEFTDPELVPLPAQGVEEHADEQAAGNDPTAFPAACSFCGEARADLSTGGGLAVCGDCAAEGEFAADEEA